MFSRNDKAVDVNKRSKFFFKVSFRCSFVNKMTDETRYPDWSNTDHFFYAI